MNSCLKLQSDDERTPLLTSVASSEAQDQSDEVSASLANHICVSHFLSIWNSRVFEFGAVLYLTTIFPGTLLPMSIYALTRGLFVILFTPAMGQYINNANRLHIIRLSISKHYYMALWEIDSSAVLQWLVIAGSCVIFYLLAIGLNMPCGSKEGLLVLLTILACVEKLCAIMNLVSVERDWVCSLLVLRNAGSQVLNSLLSWRRGVKILWEVHFSSCAVSSELTCISHQCTDEAYRPDLQAHWSSLYHSHWQHFDWGCHHHQLFNEYRISDCGILCYCPSMFCELFP